MVDTMVLLPRPKNDGKMVYWLMGKNGFKQFGIKQKCNV